MLHPISLNMAIKKNSTKLLFALKQDIFKARGAPFHFNFQEDMVEILQVILEELKNHQKMAVNHHRVFQQLPLLPCFRGKN